MRAGRGGLARGGVCGKVGFSMYSLAVPPVFGVIMRADKESGP